MYTSETTAATSDEQSVSGVKRKRFKIALACNECHDKKTKCDGKRPMCSRCQRKGRQLDECVYDEDRRKKPATE
jgi:hypothetical protein